MHKPVSVNHEEVEFGLTVSNFTTWLKSLPLLTPTQTKGNSCSGTTNISNNLSGQGTGKSMCQIKKQKHILERKQVYYQIFKLYRKCQPIDLLLHKTVTDRYTKPELRRLESPHADLVKIDRMSFIMRALCSCSQRTGVLYPGLLSLAMEFLSSSFPGQSIHSSCVSANTRPPCFHLF